MTEPANSRPAIPWKALLLEIPGAFILVAVSIWAGCPWAVVAMLAAIPVAILLLAVLLARRTTRARDGAYGLTTRGAHSEASLTLDLPMERVVRVVDDASHTIRRPRRTRLSPTGAEFDSPGNVKTWGMRILLEYRSITPDRTPIVASGPHHTGVTHRMRRRPQPKRRADSTAQTHLSACSGNSGSRHGTRQVLTIANDYYWAVR
ncbi:hypothetical protein [Kocuria turfanensis]|uniref:Uncharacterized protein n=1 Tax=Kocuria turfanensis TaxID=388357 RepID=A0A512IH82_9MICC|nr:hypothetical protein [Kocuria turfanensis]GEO97034.1 hypothetical protein KTU01_31570 [Kocuria turfanensis]